MPFSMGIFPTHGSNPGLLHWRWILYHLIHQGSPRILEWISLLQGNFPTQELNQGLLHCRWILFQLSYQFSSVAQSCPTLCDPMDHRMPGLLVYHQLPEFTQTHVHWVCDAIQPSHPLASPSPPALYLSHIRVFSNESALCIRWPKYWSFSFNISPSNEYPGLISFRMDWLNLLAVQGTLKSLLQHHSSKASILQCSAFFIVQLSHPYISTGKTIALIIWTFVGKVISLLFNTPGKPLIS